MAETLNPTIDGEKVVTMSGAQEPSAGNTGLESQLPGESATVSEVANATGGIAPGNLIEVDIDKQLFEFESDDTPLMQLMLQAKKVNVNSPEVQHYMLDEAKAIVTTESVTTGGNAQAVLPLGSSEAKIPRPFMTLLCKGVNGYDATGQNQTPGRELMLFVTGIDATTSCPIVRPVNGRRAQASDETCIMSEIPAGTELVIMTNACHETQKWVDPDVVIPQPELLYLQKSIMNQVISDYFESQAKRIPFTKAIIAEHALKTFKTRCNRTLWFGRKGKFAVDVPGIGYQMVYCTEGVRWQFKREMAHTGEWTFDQFIALAKIFYTGEDVPKSGLCLCGKNALESIQKIDWTKHPEVQVKVDTNNLGWSITRIHTVFGDLQFKREPTLDRCGYANSFAILGENRLVHYARTAEHSFNEQIEGQEAKRNGIILWNGLGLKGSCHIWVDGEEGGLSTGTGDNATAFDMWSDATAPESPVDGMVYYFLVDCKLTDDLTAKAGDMYQYKDGAWQKWNGEIFG